MQRARLPYILIPLAALIAILPLARNGCSCGHDFDFHLLNWMEAARQFTHGNFHPRWAYTAAYNAGEPRFVFYPPASWTVGAILGLGLPWNWTPIVFTWLALALSGFAMHQLTRAFAATTPALLASVFYIVNPYMLFTAYERTAYAELLAAAWIPLLLYAILRQRITIPRIAIPVSLLWITNAPAAVMSCYALGLVAIVRLVSNPGAPCYDSETWALRASVTAPAHSHPSPQSRLEQALNTLAGTALGLGLAAFYIIPAAYERRYVQIAMALVPGMRIQDNFLFHHTGDLPHDEVLHTASVIALALIAAAILALTILRLRAASAMSGISQESTEKSPPLPQSRAFIAQWKRRPSVSRRVPQPSTARRLILPLATLTFAITFLLTPMSTFVWKHLPELAFLQFPWRLVAILAAVLSLAVAAASPSFSLKPAITFLVAISLATCFVYPAYHGFRQSCDLEDTVASRLALFHSNKGSEPTDEYTPNSADNDSLSQSNPGYWLARDPAASPPTNSTSGMAPAHLIFNSPIPQILILNLRDYPFWSVTLNGTPVPSRAKVQRDDGLIAIAVPAGASTVQLTYTQSPSQTAGDVITLMSLLALGLISRPARVS